MDRQPAHSVTFISPVIRALLLFCLCVTGLAHADTAAELPALHKTVYSVKKFGTSLGEMTNELRREQDQLHYTSSARASGIAALFISGEITEHSILKQTENGALQQLSYTLDNPGKKRKNERIAFNWPASGEAQIRASYRNNNEIIRSTSATYSRQLLPLLMSRDLLQNRQRKSNQFQVVEKAKLEHYHYQLLGEETLRYKSETLNTLKFRIDKQDSDSYSHVWLAETTDYLPLKIDQYKGDDLQASLLLKHYTQTQ
ncbi:MAG TPA: DUF3108 domain-containing protein [Gammaproteobacteria bacterium]